MQLVTNGVRFMTAFMYFRFHKTEKPTENWIFTTSQTTNGLTLLNRNSYVDAIESIAMIEAAYQWAYGGSSVVFLDKHTYYAKRCLFLMIETFIMQLPGSDRFIEQRNRNSMCFGNGNYVFTNFAGPQKLSSTKVTRVYMGSLYTVNGETEDNIMRLGLATEVQTIKIDILAFNELF